MRFTTSPAIASLMAANPGLLRVLRIIEAAGFEAHLVGGSVRDVLMGRAPSDFDISTNADPITVTGLLEAEGIPVRPTGIEHGTVTAVVDGEPFEITTWRLDVATDGRRATVRHADRLEDDAMRRDFTIGALYARADGTVLDPTGLGLADVRDRRIRFVGRPSHRIEEDALRILRFFRIGATHTSGIEAGADLSACVAGRRLLDGLSRERVGSEMLKLLAAPGASQALALMARAGILERVLPTAPREEARIAQMEVVLVEIARGEAALGLAPCPLSRLAALLAEAPRGELRLSKRQARTIADLGARVRGTEALEAMAYRLGEEAALRCAVIRHALGGPPVPPDAAARARFGAGRTFPVAAKDLMARFQGPQLGAELRRLERLWLEAGLRMSRDEILAA